MDNSLNKVLVIIRSRPTRLTNGSDDVLNKNPSKLLHIEWNIYSVCVCESLENRLNKESIPKM